MVNLEWFLKLNYSYKIIFSVDHSLIDHRVEANFTYFFAIKELFDLIKKNELLSIFLFLNKKVKEIKF